MNQILTAQSTPDENDNIVISKSIKVFTFVKGNDAHPVQIKEEDNKTYVCNSFRTNTPIVKFYNDIESIDGVDIYIEDNKKTNRIIPKYEDYNSKGIFYSDQHMCYFELPFVKKGSTSQVVFKKTTLDPQYFTSVFFIDDKKILEQEVTLIVPSWMQLDIKEYNFKQYNVHKSVTAGADKTVYTFSMTNMTAVSHEEAAPGLTYFAPHILVMCKSAQPKENKYVYFNTVKGQYDWYRKLILEIGNDKNIIKDKTLEIVKGLSTDEEKVKTIFQWVQDNIRYIAFENGIAGFKPEKAQEVFRKKYGDCKGMANLLTEMLLSIGLDARRCWIGTKHIAYDYSTPSLSVDNHMISAWINKDKPVYLDATEKYIGFGEVAERIQGRQILIENGEQYKLDKVPVATYLQNTATESRKFSVDGNNLKGHVVQVWKGENKEWMLSGLNEIKQDNQENALKQFLSGGKQDYEISNLKITNIVDYNSNLKVEYDVLWKNVLTVFDKEIYLNADNRHNLENYTIDIEKRKLPYWLPFKNNLLLETEIQLPEGKTISNLPERLDIKQAGYAFRASYNKEPGKIVYKNEIILNQTEINPDHFEQWNKDIKQLSNFYNQQIVLTLTQK
ncbi:MAG: transglutaminase-like domain-containing protein [Bacteroidota bacterium]|nr:transglutaminase-like domain-containing protein [Bacteroidota bacterium]